MATKPTYEDFCKKYKIHVIFWLISVFFLFPSAATSQSKSKFQTDSVESSKLRVLVLHSYHHGFTWSDNISRGIHSVFKEQKEGTELIFEFMDTRRIHTNKYFQKLKELYTKILRSKN